MNTSPIKLFFLSAVALSKDTAAFAPAKGRHVHPLGLPPKPPTRCRKSVVAATSSSGGAFDFNADVTGKGRLVVSYEPIELPDPDPTQPVTPLYEVFPGIGLPSGEPEPPRINNTFTNAQVDRYGVGSRAFLSPMFIGKNKTDRAAILPAQELTIQLNKLGGAIPNQKDYKFFGNGDFAKSLILLLKTNPFMAPALTELPDGKGYELKTYNPDPKPGDTPTLYQTILGTLNGVGHRVNFKFDKYMEKITAWEMYDDINGSQLPGREVPIEDAASSALYNLFFFASCLHATIHVLHYLYTAAFQVASEDFPEMNKWANDYAKNIPWKYQQVGSLLLNDPTDQLSIITGGSGLGSSQVVRYILKTMLQGWGMRPSADGFFFDNMMNIPKKKLVDDGVILKEFMKHYELVTPFASAASDSLKSINATKFDAAERKLSKYLKRCGEFTSTLSSLEQWIEVMAVTGAMHGGTLSYTRLMAMPEILRWRNKVSQKWDFPDAFLLLSALGTIVGMEDERHVMTDSEGPYAPALRKVLEKFNGETTKLKKEYQEALLKRSDFNDFGWILSDYCLDDFDGKQLTIATYI